MDRLSSHQLRGLLEFLRKTYACRTSEALVRHIVSELSGLIPADLTVYDEADVRRRRHVRIVESPEGYTVATGGPGLLEVAGARLREHPAVRYFASPGDKLAVRNSDLIPFREFRRSALWNEFYRRIGVNHQVSVRLAAPRGLLTGIVMNRGGRRDFTERERLLLDLLRPHLVQAYGNVQAFAELDAERDLLEEAAEIGGRAVVILGADGRVKRASDRARRLLAAYADNGKRTTGIPEQILAWVGQQERELSRAHDAPRPRMPLVLDRDGRRLTVRLVAHGETQLLLVEEQTTAPDMRPFEQLGLTGREIEVLRWVAEGKTNGAIATILGIRPRTVEKHLEAIFRKLGVESRTAAAARVFETAHEHPDGPHP